jgi:hypothetical protein
VTGTGTGTAASDSLVGLGMVDGTSDVDRISEQERQRQSKSHVIAPEFP